jgi:glycosyltransferase involved in cell wall biosynthesis
VSADKIDVIPSLAWREFDRASMPTEKYWVYVGRIENPKGLIDLLRIWPTHEKLKVVGTGPNMSEAIEETGKSTNVDFLGFVSDDDLRQILQGATGFIFPSRWPETQGMAACEAWGAGIPVVALQGNAIAPLCIQHQIGATYADRDSDSLNGALKHITIAGEPMRRRAQEFFNVTYSRQRWLTLTEESYSKVMGESQR